VIVQEEDWGRIIAFTLRYVTAVFCAGRRLRLVGHSSFDYRRDLVNLMNPRALRSPIAHPHSPSPPATPRQHHRMSSIGRSSAFSSTSSFKFFSSSHKPDPDREDSMWDEPEAYSAVVTRKEHPRDPAALLSLREVLQRKVPVDSPRSAQSSSITVSRMASNSAPPSAWAKPAVEVKMAAVDGQVTGMPEAVVTAGRILHELDGASVLSPKGSTDSTASGFIEMNVHRGKTSSVLSQISLERLDMISAAPIMLCWGTGTNTSPSRPHNARRLCRSGNVRIKPGGCWLIRARGVRR
jgi:1-phosphatidylinositol-3-phosphate 5-kinase